MDKKEWSREYMKKYMPLHKEEKRQYDIKYRATNADKVKENNKSWRLKNPGRLKDYHKEWRVGNKDKIKNYSLKTNLKRFYGLTVQQYNQMFVNQNGLCAICNQSEEKGYRLCVDHNHETGKIRALLCSRCNVGIANLRENKYILLEAIKYLEKYNNVQKHSSPNSIRSSSTSRSWYSQ